MEELPKDAFILADGAMGIYIPKFFADNWGSTVMLSEEDKQILSNPEHELYWEVWAEIYDEVKIVDKEGTQYFLYQDGDLWAVPV